jgi:hypothetical protein
MEFKQVYACNNPLTHIQRKHFAFRKSVEFHLKIPLDLVQAGKQYYIHKFHWPIVLVRKRLATTSLLNAKCIKSIEDQQRLLYGITNEALRECRNSHIRKPCPRRSCWLDSFKRWDTWPSPPSSSAGCVTEWCHRIYPIRIVRALAATQHTLKRWRFCPYIGKCCREAAYN